MTTLATLTRWMSDYNHAVAPGGECAAWGDYVADCHARLDCAPWSDDHADRVVPADMAEYWTSVADGTCPDYDATDGSRLPQ